MKRLLLALFFTGLIVLILFEQARPSAATSPEAVTWDIFTVDGQNDVGSYLSMAVKWDTKTPYIAYYDATAGDLKLANQGPGNCGPEQSWTCAVLDSTSSSDVGQHVSLAFRTDSGYGVAYFDAANGVNRFTSPAAAIHGEVIEFVQGETVGVYNALIYDSANTAHVAYKRDISGGVGFGYAKRVGIGGNCSVSWSCLVLDNTAVGTSIDRGQYSGLGTAYGALGGYLAYARPVGSGGNCGGGAWLCEDIQGGGVAGTSLQMARCGLLGCSTLTQIAFYDYYTQQLKLAELVGNNQGNCLDKDWRCTVIDSVGQVTNFNTLGLALVLDGTQPIIVYQDLNDQANSIVKYAYRTINGNCGPNNSWRCEVVDDGFRGGGFISIGGPLDAEVIDGRLHVAYYDASFGDLLMAVESQPAPPPSSTYTVFLPMTRR